MSNEIIVLKQLPEITERLKEVGEAAKLKISEAMALPCTDENIQIVKKLRAGLRKDYAALEENRKDINRRIDERLKPFKDAYKEYIADPYTKADIDLKVRIDTLEDEKKQLKRDEVEEYFDELCTAKGIDFVPFSEVIPNVTLSDTVTKLKKAVYAYLDKVVSDVDTIKTQEHQAEILVEYKKTLNLQQSIITVSNRKKAIEEERRRADEAACAQEQRDAAVKIVDDAIEDTALAVPSAEALPSPDCPPVKSESDVRRHLKLSISLDYPDEKHDELIQILKEFKQNLIERGFTIV